MAKLHGAIVCSIIVGILSKTENTSVSAIVPRHCTIVVHIEVILLLKPSLHRVQPLKSGWNAVIPARTMQHILYSCVAPS